MFFRVTIHVPDALSERKMQDEIEDEEKGSERVPMRFMESGCLEQNNQSGRI